MRELELSISEMLKNGLKPEKVPTGAQVLTECLGFRCGKLWLEGYDQLSNPLILDIPVTWPFPVFIADEKYNILVVRDSTLAEDRVYEVSKDHDTILLLHHLDFIAYGQGSRMELADFGEYALMVNGKVTIYRETITDTWVLALAQAKIPLMGTICNFKGQAIGGGVTSPWYDCDEHHIIWSKIGELDFIPDEKNTSGFRRDPFGGIVQNVKRLGDLVIVYGSEGLTAMIPVREPAATFGFKEMYEIGIVNKGAIGGSVLRHLFVNSNYELCEVTDKGVSVLGYKEYILRLTGKDIIVSYNQSTKDFYISNGTITFLYSPTGLTEVSQHPSSVWYSENSQHMIPDTDDGRDPYLITESIDFGFRGNKTIFVLELGITNYDQALVAIDWVIGRNIFGSTIWVGENSQGVVNLIIAGTTFKVKLKLTGVTSDTIISYIKVRYKMTDLRSIRGVYAPPPRGQVG
jgi:hypothetical protein